MKEQQKGEQYKRLTSELVSEHKQLFRSQHEEHKVGILTKYVEELVNT